MHVDLSSEQKALQRELREYFTNLMTPEVKVKIRSSEEAENKEYKALIRQVGADGWLGTGWPKEYGGKGFTPIENYIFLNEAQSAGCPIPFLTLNTVGPTIREFGTPDQKDFFLPKILKGDLHFSIGYSEPEAGTDLAALKTRAVRDGDEWVINGQKLFTSLAYNADYIWLAARTDPDAPAHKGITMFAVPATDPGFKIQPYITMGAGHTTATFYDNVRVPHSAVIGEVNGGWSLITNQLNHERVSLLSSGGMINLVDQAIAWAKSEHLADGRRVIDQEWVQIKLAECKARVRFLDLFNWKVAFNLTYKKALNPAEASAIKVFGSESFRLIYKLLTEVFGATGHLRPGSPGAILAGRVEESYRSCWVLTFGGGTNEIQRDIIGMAGLGLPRERRRKELEGNAIMDFNLDETQQEIADLALRILEDRVDHNRLKEIEAGREWFDRETYTELAKAGLVGIALREDVGGGAMTVLEAALVIEQQGRTVAPMPLLPTIVAALTIDEFGSAAQRSRYLPSVSDGTIVLSIALQEYLNDNPLAPAATAKKSGSSWTITGQKVMVESAEQAHRILVAAKAGRGVGVFLVDPAANGVSLVRGVTSRKEPVHELHLDNVVATDILGSSTNGAEILSFAYQRALAFLCATQVGVTDRQLRITAKYATERHQFGRPIATFQAVTQRLANCYIDVEAVRLTTYSALWRLANGFDATEDLKVAKWFASDQAHLVAHACQHIHGGAGVDIENPLHRYTLWNKHVEGSLGAGTASLRSLGQLLAG